MVLACCSEWYNKNTGQVEPITEQLKKAMEDSIVSMA